MKTITGAQLRAARALLNISAQDLATATKLGVTTIRRAEAEDGPVSMTAANADRIVTYLNEEGVALVNGPEGGPGVRLKS